MKKILMLALSAFALNLFAYDVTGLWELTSDVTLNEDLHVHPGGVIQPYNGHWTLTVNGNIINDGTIQDHLSIGYQLYVNCSGNFTNSGTVKNASFAMNGTIPQSISTPSALSPVETYYFYVENSNTLVAQTDLYFKNSRIYFNAGGTLDLTGGYGLNLNDSYYTGSNIAGKTGTSPESYIYMENGAYINNSTCSNISTTGTFLIVDDVIIAGNSENNGEMKSWSNGHRTLTTEGNFINKGTITNHNPYETYVDAYGYFENSGTVTNATVNSYGNFSNKTNLFTPSYLYFSGTAAQNVSTAWSCPIKASYTGCSNPYGIIVTSDLYFENSLINFTDNPIEITNGYGLYVYGGYMNRMNITGKGIGPESVSHFDMSGGCYMQNTKLTDLILNGTIEMSDNNCSLEGKVLNQGTLQNRSSNQHTLIINGDFENTGTLRTNPGGYYFYVDFKGNSLYNAGTWGGYMLTFSGTTVQNISNAYGYPFTPEYTSVSNTSGILAKSDLYFVNSLINFTDNTLDLREGRNLYVSGGYINRLNLLGVGTEATLISNFDMSNGCYIQNSTLTDVVLTGTTDISDDNCKLEGKVINTGTIQNKSWYWYTLTVYGDFKNSGTVTDNLGGYNLTMNISGHKLTNEGTWSNYYTNITGTTDQQIVLASGCTINSPEIYFKTDLATAPHAWHYNNSPIELTNTDFSYSDTQNMKWNVPVSETYFGSFYCQTGEGASRKIFINDGTFSSPVITGEGYENGTTSINWESIPSAASYKIYSSPDPYADPATWTFETEVFTNGCSISGQTENKKFYFVKAIY